MLRGQVWKKVALLLLLLLPCAPDAAAVLLEGIGAYSCPRDPSHSFTPGIGYGAGLTLQLSLGKRVYGLLGSEFIFRSFSAGTATDNLTFKSQVIRIPASFHFMFGKVFNIGIGGYGSMMVGHLSYHATEDAREQNTDYSQSMDYGALGSIGVDLNLLFSKSAKRPIFLEFQYSYGLRDISASSPTYYNDLMLTLSFDISSSKSSTKKRYR